MTTHVEPVDVQKLIDDIITTVRPLARKNDNTVEVTLADNLEMMHTDATKVRQVLFNLMSNACKFTSQGDARLDVSLDDATDQVVFVVEDTGIGMTEDQVPEIFEAFTQADDSSTREFGGTGLGLTITRHFCALLGGDIDVSSKLGKGTTFTVRLARELRATTDLGAV